MAEGKEEGWEILGAAKSGEGDGTTDGNGNKCPKLCSVEKSHY